MAASLVPAARAPDAVLRGHLVDVQALAFVSTPAGQLLASGSLDGLVYLWDVAHPGAPVHKWVAHGGGLVALASLGPGQLWSQGRDGWVYLWRIGARDDGYGGAALSPPVLAAALPVGFGSFCRMHVAAATRWRADADDSRLSSSYLLAAPCLDSEKIEVWAADLGGDDDPPAVDGGNGGAADTTSASTLAPITGSITGATLTRVHADSAHPAAFGGAGVNAGTNRHRGTFRLQSVVAVPKSRAGATAAATAGQTDAAAAAAAGDLESSLIPAAVGDVVTPDDDAYEYGAASAEDGGTDGLAPDDPTRFSALRQLQGRSGMVSALQLLDPAVALPGLAAALAASTATAAEPGGRNEVAANCDTNNDDKSTKYIDPVAARSSPAGDEDSGGDGDRVSHPLPEAGSLREMFALRGHSAAATSALLPAVVPPPTAAPSPAHDTSTAPAVALFTRPPAFLLAAVFENGRFYVLADAPPPQRRRLRRRGGDSAGGRWPRGLAQLRDDDESDGTQPAPVDAAQPAARRAAVLVDIHLSTDPLLTFTLGAAYRHGVAAGAGGDITVFALDIPRRAASVTRRIALAKPGASVSAPLSPFGGGSAESADDGAPPPSSSSAQSVAVVGGWDGTARLVDLPTGAQLAALHWHGVSVYSLAAAPAAAPPGGDDDGLDGFGGERHAGASYRVATGSKDGRVALWTVDVD